ncbi:reverse transcriptase [Abeliophyllum distichum]|uniref:Reverse transcriptase n=1 Tax=Abeliophyllum distichum TaxID=126358 RepID=A0ABD1UP30_9LAMI
MEVYVDDMVFKSAKTYDHISNLQQAFHVARLNMLKFIPEKCIFSTAGGKFLGFMITQRRIRLTLIRSGDVLSLYLAASPRVFSAMLIRELTQVQRPIYYVSQVLKGAETCYSLAEQLVFALIVAVRKLRPYFQSHNVHIITNQPIKQILHRPKTLEKMLNRAVELSEFNIEFKPRTIKAHVLADFIVELTMQPSVPEDDVVDWKIFVAGLYIVKDLARGSS